MKEVLISVKDEILWLKKNFPLDKKVSIWFVDYKRYFGATFDLGDRFVIKIAKRLDWDTMVDTLYHEWAHCLTFDIHPDHSRSWACAYGKILRKSHKEKG